MPDSIGEDARVTGGGGWEIEAAVDFGEGRMRLRERRVAVAAVPEDVEMSQVRSGGQRRGWGGVGGGGAAVEGFDARSGEGDQDVFFEGVELAVAGELVAAVVGFGGGERTSTMSLGLVTVSPEGRWGRGFAGRR